MNKNSFTKLFLPVAAACMFLFFLGTDAMSASPNCSGIGVWFGQVTSGNTYMLTVGRGSSAKSGDLNIEWVLKDATIGGVFPTAVRVTNGVGVWEKINSRNIRWTWVLYGLDASGAIVYSQRLSGNSELVDCDHANDTWVAETWLGSQDMNTDPPVSCVPGTGTETRMQLVQAACE